jgi:hypothetical protein
MEESWILTVETSRLLEAARQRAARVPESLGERAETSSSCGAGARLSTNRDFCSRLPQIGDDCLLALLDLQQDRLGERAVFLWGMDLKAKVYRSNRW